MSVKSISIFTVDACKIYTWLATLLPHVLLIWTFECIWKCFLSCVWRRGILSCLLALGGRLQGWAWMARSLSWAQGIEFGVCAQVLPITPVPLVERTFYHLPYMFHHLHTGTCMEWFSKAMGRGGLDSALYCCSKYVFNQFGMS